MNWLTFKAKLWALGAGILAIAAFFLRFKQVKHQRDKAVAHKEIAEATVRRAKVIQAEDNELSTAYKSHRAEIAKDIKNDEVPDNIRNPNSW